MKNWEILYFIEKVAYTGSDDPISIEIDPEPLLNSFKTEVSSLYPFPFRNLFATVENDSSRSVSCIIHDFEHDAGNGEIERLKFVFNPKSDMRLRSCQFPIMPRVTPQLITLFINYCKETQAWLNAEAKPESIAAIKVTLSGLN